MKQTEALKGMYDNLSKPKTTTIVQQADKFFDVDELSETEITEEEVTQLRKWNWMYDSDCECLACFV